MNSLLPPNTTAVERKLEQVTASIGDLSAPLRDIWNPATCPEHLLPWLAWAFSVDRWEEAWSVEQKRQIIATAVAIHRRKGTPADVREVIELIFGGGEILEAWQFGGQPYTFKIATTGQLASDADYQRLIRMVDDTKPARAWLAALQVKRSATLAFTLGTYTHTGTHMVIRSQIDPRPSATTVTLGLAMHSANTTTVHPARVALTPAATALTIGTAALIATTTTIQPRA